MLLFDLGNSRLKAALAGSDGLQQRLQLDYHDRHWPSQLAGYLDAHAAAAGRQARLVCVTTADRRVVLEAALGERAIACSWVRRPRSDALLRLAYAQPEHYGADRWLGLRAARRRFPGVLLLASAGSALTVDAVDADGQHLGGLIAPAPARAIEALQAKAGHLQVAEGALSWLAVDTAGAVRSGAWLAAASLIDRSVAELSHRLGQPPRLLLSGGDGERLRPWLQSPAEGFADAVLLGLADPLPGPPA